MDPINVSNIATQSTNEVTKVKPTITNEDFETVRTKSAEADIHVEKLKDVGLVSDDQIKLANLEAQSKLELYVQPGNELNGYNSIFHNNRTELDKLRTELDNIGKTKDVGEVTNYLDSVDKDWKSLETVLNSVDVNGPINHMDMIKLQVKMGSITEHVEILSKVVDQISSGMKTVLQTNI